MAQVIKLKRSSVAGKTPTASDLQLGELGINTVDGKIYFEKNDGSPSVETIVTTDSQTTGSIEITGTGKFGTLNVGGGVFTSSSLAAAASAQIFKTFSVAGQSDVVADANSDSITFAAGSNMTITTNAGTDTITFASSVESASSAQASYNTLTTDANQYVPFFDNTDGGKFYTDPSLLYNPNDNTLTTNLIGNASTATTASAASALYNSLTTDADQFVPFFDAADGGNFYTDPGLKFNPNDNTLSTSVIGNASTATTASAASAAYSTLTTSENQFVPFFDAADGGKFYTDGGLKYNPSTNKLSTSLTGNADTATTASAVTAAYNTLTTSADQFVPFFDAADGGKLYTDAGLKFNPSTNKLSTSLTGNADTATTASAASALYNSLTTSADQFVPFFDAADGGKFYTDAGLKYNPSTNVLTTTVLSATSANSASKVDVDTDNTNSAQAIPFLSNYTSGYHQLRTDSGNVLTYNPNSNTLAVTNVTLSGNLTVNGTTTTIDSTTINLGDRIIELNADSAAGDGGLYVRDASGNETGSLLWDVSENRWMGGLKDSEVNLVTISSTDTLTNKGINLANNTVTGTTAEFNTALSDDSFATLTNSVTLTNKTLTNPTLSGHIIGNISGSLSSTGSFGAVEVVGMSVPNVANFSSSIASRVSAIDAAGSGITISNNVNNRVLTGDGSNANAEANLLFDGTKLSGSAATTGSFGHLMVGGGNFTSASLAAGGGGGGTGTGFPFTGSAGLSGSMDIIGSGSNIFTVDGTNGRLFSVSDVMSGSVFSANLVSGLPVIEAFSDNIVKIGKFSNPIIISGSGVISGSATSTASFGHIMVGGGNFTSASLAGGGGGTITALNNQTANRLVTIGSTTTELDGEANLTFDGSTLGVTGVVSVSQGSAASPSLTFTGDTDTGFYETTFNQIGVTTGGSQRLTIDSAAITFPNADFKISGSLSSTGSFGRLQTAGNLGIDGGIIDLKNDGAQSELRLYCEVNNQHYASLKAPAHSDFGGNVTLTLPATTDTIVGRTTTDTLTNKTLTTPTINGVVGGTATSQTITTLTSTTVKDFTSVSGSSTSTGSFGSVHTAGDIGIGTTSPNNKLDVRRASDGIALELHSTVGDADEFVDFKMISGNTTAGTLGTIFRHQRQGSGGGDMIIFTNPGLTSTPLETIRFTSDQKVGIGNTAPPHPLTVEGVISGSGTGYFGNIILGGTEQIAVNNGNLYYTGGNLGIGTTSPTHILEVSASDSGDPIVDIYNTHTTNGYGLRVTGGDDGNVYTARFQDVSSNPSMTIWGDGDVEFHATNATISGSSTSTGSFGHLMVGGGNFTSASLAAGGGGGGSSFAGAAGTEALFSGSLVSSASFGKGGVKIIDSDLETQVVTRDWDLSTVSLDKFMQDGAVSDEWGDGWGITCSPDGKNVYVSLIGSTGDLPDSIVQYSLSSSFDIGSRTLHGSKDVSSQGSLHRAMVFSPDGLKLITVETQNSKYNEYNLTKPWDITTLTYVQNATLQGSSQQGITARPDGLRLYQIGENDAVLELVLTSPWDVSTIQGSATSTSVSADGGTEHTDIWFRRDGRFAYLFDKNDKDLHKWELSTPWKFSTAAYTGENVAIPNNIKMWGNPEGTRLFGLDYSQERINQYSWNGGPTPHQTSSIDIIGKTGISGDTTIYQNLEIYGRVYGTDADFKGDISGSATSTGSFGHIKIGGGNFTSASLAAGGGGGEANQNAFSTIAVAGQDNVVADSATDTLTLAAGSNVTLTTTAGSDTVTIAAAGGGGSSPSAAQVSGSWRGELSSSAVTVVGGGVSGSLVSTGSFGKLVSAAGLNLGGPTSDIFPHALTITDESPAIILNDTNVSNLQHRIFGGGNQGLEFSVDANNVGAGYFRVDLGGAERMRINEGGLMTINLGISGSLISTGSFGDGRVVGKLSVGSSESPSAYDAGANTMLVSNTAGNAGMTIRSSTSGGGTLHFADGTVGNAAYRGVIKYGHSDDDFSFWTAGAERMRIDSSGVLKNMAGVSGSLASTGSFGHIMVGGGNFTSASLAAGGGGGGGSVSEAFKTISVAGQDDVVADSATDTLTLVAGSNMTLTTSAGGDSITFASSGGGGGGGTNSGSFTFVQAGDSANWAITHSLGTKHNAITVYDDTHQVVIPTSITADDSNKTSITFSSPTAGYAVVNSGGTTGTVTRVSTDGSHVHYQAGDSANWPITHSLNSKYPNVTVYDDNDEVVIPSSIKADSVDLSTITFSSPTSGRAVFSMGGNLSGSLTSTGSFGRVDAQDGFYDGGTKLSVPDYVFEPEYELKSISELDTHISQSKHLPNVPDMNAFDEWKQLSMGDRDMLLLEKIEEMSLYIIQLHKRLEKLEKKS